MRKSDGQITVILLTKLYCLFFLFENIYFRQYNVFLIVFPGGGGWVLPYKGLIKCSQPGYVFQDFCLKQGIDFIIFCLNQGIDFINFCLKQGIFLNSFVIANGLNKKEFQYLLLSYTGCGFGLNVLNRVSKIGILS